MTSVYRRTGAAPPRPCDAGHGYQGRNGVAACGVSSRGEGGSAMKPGTYRRRGGAASADWRRHARWAAPRLAVTLFERSSWPRRQGGGPRSRGLPLRHGADHPHAAVGAGAASFAEAVENTRRLPRSWCQLDPQWRCFFPRRRRPSTFLGRHSGRCATPLEPLRSGQPGWRRGIVTSWAFAERLHGISERFFFWRSLGGLR